MTLLIRDSRVLASAGGCVGQEGTGCVIQGEGEDISTLPNDFGDFNRDLGQKSWSQSGTGMYAGNFGSATASASQISALVPGASSLVVNAVGSAAGTSNRVLGPIPMAYADSVARSSLLVRFRVDGGGLPYRAAGAVLDDQPLGGARFGLYMAYSPYTIIERFENTEFDVSGTLPPGTYEVHVEVSCNSGFTVATTTACDTAFSTHFQIGQ